MHLKLDYNLAFIITLENMKLYYHMLLKIGFIYSLLYKKRSSIKNINEIAINMQTNDFTRKIVIKQKNQKKESMNLELL
jgi:hypothetical protein